MSLSDHPLAKYNHEEIARLANPEAFDQDRADQPKMNWAIGRDLMDNPSIRFPADEPDFNPFYTEPGHAAGYDRTLTSSYPVGGEALVMTGGNTFRFYREKKGEAQAELVVAAGDALPFTNDDFLICNGWSITYRSVAGGGMIVGIYNTHAYGPIGTDPETGSPYPTNEQGWCAMVLDTFGIPRELHTPLSLSGTEAY